MELRAIDRQQRCGAEHPDAAAFWQIYHYLNERRVTITDENGTREEIHQTLNHSAERGLIAINIEHFMETCRKAGQEQQTRVQLLRALPQSTTHKFIANRKTYSRIERRGAMPKPDPHFSIPWAMACRRWTAWPRCSPFLTLSGTSRATARCMWAVGRTATGALPALQLPIELFDQYQGNRSASIAALPGLRPGATINQDQRITSVMLADTQMVLQWKKS